MSYITKFNKLFFYIGIIGACFLMLSISISTALTSICYVTIMSAFILSGSWPEKIKIIKNPIIIIAIAFVLSTIFSGLYSNADFDNILTIIGKYSKILVIWPLIFFLSSNYRYFRFAITAFTIGILANLFAIYVNYFILPQSHAIVFNNPGWPSAQNHFIFAYIMIFFSFSCYFLASSKEINLQYKTILYSMAIIAIFAEIFLNSARTGYVMEIILIFIIYILRYRYKGLIFSIIFIPILIYSAYNISPIFKQRVNAAITNYTSYQKETPVGVTSIGSRLYFNKISFGIIRENPYKIFFGNGSGSYPKLADIYVAENQSKLPKNYRAKSTWNPENQYILITIENGLIGLILFLSIFVIFIAYTKKNLSTKYYLSSITLSIGMLVGCMFSSWLRDSGPSMVFYALCGLIISKAYIKENTQPYK